MQFFRTASILVLFSMMPVKALAQTVLTDSFTSASSVVSGTAVLNLELGRIQPRLRVENYGNLSNESDFINIGDGSDGAFTLSRYAEFSRNGDISGQIIRLDLSRFPILNLTSFTLEAGWTIVPEGADVPLQIRSQGDVTINGSIDCSGDDGESVTGATPTEAGEGGQGRCGGADGGNGGTPAAGGAVNGEDGDDVTNGPTGGNGGTHTAGANGAGGGGGGGFSSVVTAAAGSYAGGGTASAGTAGSRADDPDFTYLVGGAGGGGGSGGATQAGAGGGAGGGAISIIAGGSVNIGSSGKIWARGGAGGSTTGLSSGGGGAGGGGSIRIFSAGNVNSANATGDDPGEIDAQRDVRGTGGTGSHGGNGGWGRTWVTTLQAYAATADLIPDVENPFTPGDIRYYVGEETLESKVFDLDSTLPKLSSLVISPTSNDVTVKAKGSNDNFIADATDWTLASAISALNDRRYFKFQFTINNTSGTNPVVIESATLTYEKGTRAEFDFKAAGCGSVAARPPTPLEQAAILFLFLLPLVIVPGLQIRRKWKCL